MAPSSVRSAGYFCKGFGACAVASGLGGSLRGFGYDDLQWKEGRHPNRDELDAAFKDAPVVIVHQSGQIGVVDGKALELAGAASDAKDPTGGVFRRSAGGLESKGVCEE